MKSTVSAIESSGDDVQYCTVNSRAVQTSGESLQREALLEIHVCFLLALNGFLRVLRPARFDRSQQQQEKHVVGACNSGQKVRGRPIKFLSC